MKYTILVSLLIVVQAQAQKSPATSTSRTPLKFISPLQSFTIFDSSTTPAAPRAKFLPRLRTGLLGERKAREVLNDELRSGLTDNDADWAERSAREETRRNRLKEARVERGYDEAVKLYDAKLAAREAQRAATTAAANAAGKSAYQFVGVINNDNKKEVTWYARKKPSNSKWNLRLIHVNRDAVLRDLFVKGKIDLFGGYKNKGMGVIGGAAEGESDDRKPKILGEYTVKERSWRWVKLSCYAGSILSTETDELQFDHLKQHYHLKQHFHSNRRTLWNFSPIRFFTIPSGSYHRERRLTPGIYTDGVTVYESVYRYRDGKNGMKPLGDLDKYLEKGADKERIMTKLRSGVPDVVVEK